MEKRHKEGKENKQKEQKLLLSKISSSGEPMSHLCCCSDHHQVQGTHYTQPHGLKLALGTPRQGELAQHTAWLPLDKEKAQRQEAHQLMPTNK